MSNIILDEIRCTLCEPKHCHLLKTSRSISYQLENAGTAEGLRYINALFLAAQGPFAPSSSGSRKLLTSITRQLADCMHIFNTLAVGLLLFTNVPRRFGFSVRHCTESVNSFEAI